MFQRRYVRDISRATMMLRESASTLEAAHPESPVRAETSRGIRDALRDRSFRLKVRVPVHTESFTYIRTYATTELTLCLTLAGSFAGASIDDAMISRYDTIAKRVIASLSDADPRLLNGAYHRESLGELGGEPLYASTVDAWLENWRKGNELRSVGWLAVLKELRAATSRTGR